jgi:hypothetical protein
MTSTDINEILTNPQALALVNLDELRNLQKKFPYSQGFHFLIAKKLLEDNSVEFEASLHMAATYALDRRFLYEYLHHPPKKTSDNLNVPSASFSKFRFEPIEEEDLNYDEWVEDIDAAEGYKASDEDENPPSIEADIDKRLKEILGKFSETPADQHLLNAVNRIRNMELGNEPKSKAPIEIPEEQRFFIIIDNLEEIRDDGLETDDLLSNHWQEEVQIQSSIEFIQESEFSDDDESDEMENERLERLKGAIRQKHIERLRASVDAFFKLSEEQLQQSEENVVLTDIPDNVSFKDWFASLKSHKRLEEDEAHELANISLEEDDELMSEALAELLASQGNKERAAKMYEHLILKFPEKKRFFAMKIEDLR